MMDLSLQRDLNYQPIRSRLRLKLTILAHYPADRNLAIGEASKVKKLDGQYTILMPCPKCGIEMLLSHHNINWHTEDVVTVEPSIVCRFPNKVYSAQILHDVDNCQGHFFIKNGEILELSS